MLRQYQPCIPTRSKTVPTGPQWVHEIKHDGYRMIVRRTGDGVRLITKRGYDWTKRYPVIAGAAGKLKVRSATIDGEAVVCGPDGVSDFERLHSRGYDHQAILYAFDLLELDGLDLRALALEERKARLAALLRARAGRHPSGRAPGRRRLAGNLAARLEEVFRAADRAAEPCTILWAWAQSCWLGIDMIDGPRTSEGRARIAATQRARWGI